MNEKLYIVGAGASSKKSEFRLVESRHLLCLQVDQPFFIYTMKTELTYEEAHKRFSYDAHSGKLYWKTVYSNRLKVGDEAGCVHKERGGLFYRIINVYGVWQRAHRIIWLMHYGVSPKHNIDHIDHDGLNNRIENLRDVPQKINTRNCGISKNNTSGYTGVFKSRGRWCARIYIDGKYKYIGSFDRAIDASHGYRKEALMHGFHENHGL